MTSSTSISLIGHAFLNVLSAASMRDLESPHVTGEMMIEHLRREGFIVTDIDPTTELPMLDAHMAARYSTRWGTTPLSWRYRHETHHH